LTRWTCPSAGRAVEAGSASRYGDRHGVRYTDQERSTSNFQLGDRKGAWWQGYGDRHAIWATGLWPGGPVEAPVGRSRLAGRPDMGTDTMSGIPIRNVQRPTCNSEVSTGRPKGRMAGGIWGQTRDLDNRTLAPADLTQRRSDGRGGLGAQIWGQARNFTQIWGQAPNLGDRTLDGGPVQALVGWSKPAVMPRYGDRHDVRYTGQERST